MGGRKYLTLCNCTTCLLGKQAANYNIQYMWRRILHLQVPPSGTWAIQTSLHNGKGQATQKWSKKIKMDTEQLWVLLDRLNLSHLLSTWRPDTQIGETNTERERHDRMQTWERGERSKYLYGQPGKREIQSLSSVTATWADQSLFLCSPHGISLVLTCSYIFEEVHVSSEASMCCATPWRWWRSNTHTHIHSRTVRATLDTHLNTQSWHLFLCSRYRWGCRSDLMRCVCVCVHVLEGW